MIVVFNLSELDAGGILKHYLIFLYEQWVKCSLVFTTHKITALKSLFKKKKLYILCLAPDDTQTNLTASQ